MSTISFSGATINNYGTVVGAGGGARWSGGMRLASAEGADKAPETGGKDSEMGGLPSETPSSMRVASWASKLAAYNKKSTIKAVFGLLLFL
ncbi:unnamed protein product [Fusarium venenatum]|uniref:Uncharacterized protein n=1 Tax=Fusarium venenatum TaxID=56646 RepID=A0A2L2SQ34_9HYPO|nr:uncharacterized protein FVRRES_11462 [Fusarium venenatum]CEI38771.1 unnamed protein product [Fusarium venenatum]